MGESKSLKGFQYWRCVKMGVLNFTKKDSTILKSSIKAVNRTPQIFLKFSPKNKEIATSN